MHEETVTLHDIRTGRTSAGIRATYEFSFRGRHELWYEFEGAVPEPTADAFLCAVLIHAMAVNAPIVLPTAIDPTLARNVDAIQRLLHAWDPQLAVVPIQYPAGQQVAGLETDLVPPTPARTVAFFSGGVDSSYTAIKHRARLSAAIIVLGFDVPVGNTVLGAKVRAGVEAMLGAIAVPPIVVRTNMRDVLERGAFGPWPRGTRLGAWEWTHGSAIASISHQWTAEPSTVLVAGPYSRENCEPHGSHFVLDPLWSSGRVTTIHDGLEASRIDKLRLVGTCPTALAKLRVCWRNPGNAYNCGRCEKCLRTMLNLKAAGLLDACPAFEAPLDYDAIARLRIGPITRALMRQNLEALEAQGADPALLAALRRVARPWTPIDHMAAFSRRMSGAVARRLPGIREWAARQRPESSMATGTIEPE